jgi:hypothetical protein
MQYSVERKSCDGGIKQERLGQLLIFKRGEGKTIKFVGSGMEAVGYKDLSDLLEDLTVIARIDCEETED